MSIVTTPKTLGKMARLSSSFIEVETISEGVNEVINEIKSGIVPPVGGKAIQVRSTGETAFVGFGSAVIDKGVNKAIQVKLNLNSKKMAAARAKAALCGLMIGDKVIWEGGVSSEQQDETKGFNMTDDPINENRAGNIDKLDKVREDFYNRTKSTDAYVSAQKGNLPPGVNSKDWIDSEGAWAYSIAIYMPSATQAAADTKVDMDNAVIVQPIKKKSNGTSGAGDNGAAEASGSHRMNSQVRGEGEAVEQGPTGQVSKDEDL